MHTTSLDFGRKLKEKGIDSATYFRWACLDDATLYDIVHPLGRKDGFECVPIFEVEEGRENYAAFSLGDLLGRHFLKKLSNAATKRVKPKTATEDGLLQYQEIGISILASYWTGGFRACEKYILNLLK